MPFFKSLRADAGVADIYRSRPAIYRHWIRMGEEVMTKDSPLTQGERELIATYVSSLNNCDYCRAAHLPSMALHGIRQEVVDGLVAGIDGADVPERMKPIFAFAKKLTLTPSAVRQEDADAVYAAGWDEEALHTVIAVVCRFNFMNRLVIGHGLKPPGAEEAMENARRRLTGGYAGMHGTLAEEEEKAKAAK